MSRVHTQLGDDVNLTRLAAYFFATTRGIPQFYYGTEILMSNTGDDSHGNIRSDFPGGWTGDLKSAFSANGLTEEAKAFQQEMRKLLQWRRTSSAVASGRMTHFVPEDAAYVYFRESKDETVMVVLNKSAESSAIDLARFDEVLQQRRDFKNALDPTDAFNSEQLLVPAWGAKVLLVQ